MGKGQSYGSVENKTKNGTSFWPCSFYECPNLKCACFSTDILFLEIQLEEIIGQTHENVFIRKYYCRIS